MLSAQYTLLYSTSTRTVGTEHTSQQSPIIRFDSNKSSFWKFRSSYDDMIVNWFGELILLLWALLSSIVSSVFAILNIEYRIYWIWRLGSLLLLHVHDLRFCAFISGLRESLGRAEQQQRVGRRSGRLGPGGRAWALVAARSAARRGTQHSARARPLLPVLRAASFGAPPTRTARPRRRSLRAPDHRNWRHCGLGARSCFEPEPTSWCY